MPSVVAVRHGGPRRSLEARPAPAADHSTALPFVPHCFRSLSGLSRFLLSALLALLGTGAALAQTVQSTVPTEHTGGEANLVVPALNNPSVLFLGMTGEHLLMVGLLVCALGLIFGLMVFTQLKNAPVHESMREI